MQIDKFKIAIHGVIQRALETLLWHLDLWLRAVHLLFLGHLLAMDRPLLVHNVRRKAADLSRQRPVAERLCQSATHRNVVHHDQRIQTASSHAPLAHDTEK